MTRAGGSEGGPPTARTVKEYGGVANDRDPLGGIADSSHTEVGRYIRRGGPFAEQ